MQHSPGHKPRPHSSGHQPPAHGGQGTPGRLSRSDPDPGGSRGRVPVWLIAVVIGLLLVVALVASHQ
jgi:hypothetical protein